MTSLKRAALSILHYWKTNVLLVVLFTVIATLLLNGLSVKDASQAQTVSIRRQLGGNVIISGLMDNKGDITGPLTLKQLSAAAALPHVTQSNFIVTYLAKPCGDAAADMIDKNLQKGTVELCGQCNTSMQEEFRQRKIFIKTGRGLDEKDLSSSNAVISADYAKINNLKQGNKISFELNGKTVAFQVVGIFAQTDEHYTESDNTVYVPYTVLRSTVGKDEFFHAEFMIDDPVNVTAFRSQVLQLGLDIQPSQISAQDDAYRQLSGPVDSLSYIASAMVSIMLAAGAVIFSLILLLNLRSRKYEIGILLSLGESKLKILTQLAVEALVPILIAFSLSVGTGKLCAQTIGNVMFASQTAMQVPTVESDGKSFQAETNITVQVTPGETGMLYLSGLAITLVSVAASSVLIMRYRPHEILTQDE